MKKLLIFSLIIFSLGELTAQSFYSRSANRRWIATGGVGYARSLGDLTNPGTYFDTKLNLEAGLEYQMSDRFIFRTSLLLFQMSGSDQDIDPELNTRSRGLEFVSNNAEFSTGISISLFPKGRRFIDRKLINPYVYAGVGVLLFDPKNTIPDSTTYLGTKVAVPNAGDRVSLRPYQTNGESYGLFTFVIPVGIGVKIKATDFMDVSLEVANRITFTDFLDDVGTRQYPSDEYFQETFDNEKAIIASALSDPSDQGELRGNPDRDDYYMIFSIKANFYIQSRFLDNLFGTGSRRFNVRPKRRGGLFNRGPRRRSPF